MALRLLFVLILAGCGSGEIEPANVCEKSDCVDVQTVPTKSDDRT